MRSPISILKNINISKYHKQHSIQTTKTTTTTMKLNQATAAAFLSAVSAATLASSSLVASTAPYDKLKDKIASLSLLHPSPIFYTYTGHRMLQEISNQCSTDIEAGRPTFFNALNNAFKGCALAQSETQEDTAPTTVETDFSACGSSLFAEACTEDKGKLDCAGGLILILQLLSTRLDKLTNIFRFRIVAMPYRHPFRIL